MLLIVLPSVLGAAPLSSPPPLPACQTECVTPFGTPLGSAHRVEARSNCSSECVDPRPIAFPTPGVEAPVYTGIGWQCVEYARRYWLTHHGVVFGSVDTAADMWERVREGIQPATNATVPVSAHPNGGPEAPKVGDLLIYAADPTIRSLRFGHVAVVVTTAPDSLRLAEQNWDNKTWAETGFARQLEVQRGAGTVRVVEPKGQLLGWLRLEPPPTTLPTGK